MKTFVVLPTYNEAINIQKMIPAILEVLPQASILIVDDNSPDGTGKIADSLAQKFPHAVSVFHREKKEGLGKAYLFGFQKALDLGAEAIIQMDSDFSHPVALLPQLLASLREFDFAIASRYVRGGGTRNWGMIRQMISRGGNFYARFILGSSIQDLTGGYKAFNRKVLEFLLQASIDCSGYSFQIETTSYALAVGYKCVELPFIFSDRVEGVSKMSKAIILEAFLKTFKVRQKVKKLKASFPLPEVSEPAVLLEHS